MNTENKKLFVNICGVELKNPFIAASGTFGFGQEYSDLVDVSLFGAICSKGLTILPKAGNDGIRIFETTSGIMNSVGMENPGIDSFIKKELPEMQKLNTKIIANVGGGCVQDYIQAIEKLNDKDVDLIELNISCPNVKSGCMSLGMKSSTAFDAVQQIRKVCTKPLIVKLSPNAENIVSLALACEEAGADAISLVNTFQAMAIDVKKRKAVFENLYAGLSGPAIKPIALRMVHQVCSNCKIPVIGLGGITSGIDAIEFIMAGACAVQIGTANFMNPLSIKKIINEFVDFIEKENIKDISEIRGII